MLDLDEKSIHKLEKNKDGEEDKQSSAEKSANDSYEAILKAM